MTVHSTQLGHGAGVTTAGATLYTCPAGKRAIVKSIWVRNTNAGASGFVIRFDLAGGAQIGLHVTLTAYPSAGDTVLLQPWVVLNPGDALKVFPSANTIDVIASGTELTL